MKIKSPVFISNEEIPFKYTCDGENVSPPLFFKDVPGSARHLALVVDDPDAPHGTFTHWIVWNIKPTAIELREGRPPDGSVEGSTSAGDIGYVGPCPPSGMHRYFFKLYALSKELSLEEGADISQFEKAIKNCVIEKAELVGTYSRQ